MQLEALGVRFYLGLSLDPSLPRPGWRLSIKTSRGNLGPEFRNWEAGTDKGVPGDVKHPLWDLQVATGWVAYPPHPPPAGCAWWGWVPSAVGGLRYLTQRSGAVYRA